MIENFIDIKGGIFLRHINKKGQGLNLLFTLKKLTKYNIYHIFESNLFSLLYFGTIFIFIVKKLFTSTLPIIEKYKPILHASFFLNRNVINIPSNYDK